LISPEPGLTLGREDDSPGFDKFATDVDGTVEESPGIIPHVENKGVHAFLLKLVEGIRKLHRGWFAELENARVTHTIGSGETGVEDAGILNRRLLDHLTLHLKLVQFLRCRAPYRESERFTRPALEHVDRLSDPDILGKLVVDLENLVARENPGTGSRPVLTRGHDGESITLRRDGDADPLIGAVCLPLQLVENFRLHELAVRVEISEHAFEGAVDEFLVGDFIGINVTLTDCFKHFGEEFQFFESRIRLFPRLLCARTDRPYRQRYQSREE